MVRLVVLAVVGSIIAYPWIIDGVLRYYIAGQGISVEQSKAGYTGMEWRGLSLSGDGFQVEIESISVPSLRSILGLELADKPIRVDGVVVDLSKAGSESAESENKQGLAGLLETALDILPTMEKLLPSIKIEGTRIIFEEDRELVADSLTWSGGQIHLESGRWQGSLPEGLEGKFSLPEVSRISLGRRGERMLFIEGNLSQNFRLYGTLGLNSEDQPTSHISSSWPDGELNLSSGWDSAGWEPAELSIQGKGFSLPYLTSNSLADFQPHLTVDASFNFRSGIFSIQIDGSGNYQSAELTDTSLPWSVSVQAAGDPDEIQVSRVNIDLPGLFASLSNKLVLNRSNYLPDSNACFNWDLDFVSSPLEGLEGKATGTICLRPIVPDKSGSFEIEGLVNNLTLPRDLWADQIDNLKFRADGTLNETAISAENIMLHSPDLGQVQGRLKWPWERSMLNSLTFEGKLLPKLLESLINSSPIQLSDDGLKFSFTAEETSSGWEHSGNASTNQVLIRDGFAVDTQVSWLGVDKNIEDWTIEISRDSDRLTGRGAAQLTDDSVDMRIDELSHELQHVQQWHLSEPAQILYRFGGEQSIPQLSLSPVNIQHKQDGKVSISGKLSAWSELELNGDISHLSLGDLFPWIAETHWSTISFKGCSFSLISSANPSGGHTWSSEGSFDAEWTSPAKHQIAGRGAWSVGENKLQLTDMFIGVDGEDWFFVEGIVPVRFLGTDEKPLTYKIEPEEPLEFNVMLEPIQTIPPIIANQLPFDISDFRANLNASGTFAKPRAQIKASAGMLSWKGLPEESVHSAMDVRLSAIVGIDSLLVEEFSLRLPEADRAESLKAEAHDIDWAELVENPRKYPWNDLSGFVQLEKFPVSSLGSLLPEEFLRRGSLSLDLRKNSGQYPTGNLAFEGLTWRAVDAGIVAREMSGHAHMDGYRLDDLKLTANVGGGIVHVDGWMDFTELRDPRFRITLESDRFDLVRRSDLILRGKSSLEAVYENSDTAPLLQGEIEMIRSLWLKDLEDFTQQGVAGVSRRPPYFSVQNDTFSNWRLDLNIHGEKFLKLQSSLIKGTASAQFYLRGTLGEPILVGGASLIDGAISFPFANLKTTAIELSITEDDPHTIRLSGSGEGVVYGYLVNYQLSGTSESPSITLSSVPSLAQHDILLMLTTGAVPSGELTANITERTSRLGFFIGQDYFSSLIGSDGASRLEFRTGDGFSPFQREGQLLEYRINDNWSIIGEYDDYGSYNVDIRRILLKR